LYIGEGPESDRVVYTDTYTGHDSMSRARIGFAKRVGQLSSVFGSPMEDLNERGVCRAMWQPRLSLYGEADVHLRMEEREEEDAD
jgi:hypothetical protein